MYINRNATYHNNIPYGISPRRPVEFVKAVKETVDGKDALVIYSSLPFFDEMHVYCEFQREFFAEFDFCLAWNVQLTVYVTDDNGTTKYPLLSRNNGFAITSDQIQPFTSGGINDVIRMWACYDEKFGTNHITIANYFPRHISECSCEDEPETEPEVTP